MSSTNYKIGLYVRVSTKEQAENPEGSIKNQKQRLLEEVSRKNEKESFGEVVQIYSDEGLSAKDTKRQGYQAMFRDVRAKRIDMVMTSELSRISRNLKDFCLFWDEIKTQKCGLISLRENYDTSTIMGEFMVQHGVLMSQHERLMIKDRVTQGMNDRAKRGLFNGGNIPLGYQLRSEKKGHLAVDEDAKDIVILAFDLFLQTEGLAGAARALNEKGHKIRGKFFTVSNLDYLLKNRNYLGLRPYKSRGEKLEVKACWDAIVDESKFEKVQKLLKKNRFHRKSPSKSRYPYLLSGLCFCADCGDTLVGKSAHGNGGKVGYYAHGKKAKELLCNPQMDFECIGRRRYPAKKLEPVVLEKVQEMIQNPVLAKKIWERSLLLKGEGPSRKEMDYLLKNLGRVKKEETVLAGRISKLPEDVPADALYQKLKDLAKQRDELNKRLAVASPREEREKQCELGEFRDFLELVDQCLKNADENLKSKIISKLVHRVEVSESTVKVWFYMGSETIRGQGQLCSLFLKEVSKSECLEFKIFSPANGSAGLTNGGRDKD
jgi:DNA invertase Pin-like site-specific DNA recombinase